MSNSSDPIRERYKISDVKESIGEKIVDKGFEVGLHTGYYSYDDASMVKKEKNDLEKTLNITIEGARNHFLRFKGKKSWEVLSEAGLQYDSSYGYHNMIGFKEGIGYPFYPVLREGKRILEIPLNIMDGTLFDYMKLSPKEAWEKIERLLKATKRNNGVLSVLWHNATFSYPIRHPWIKVYEKILSWAYRNNGYLSDCSSIKKYFDRLNR